MRKMITLFFVCMMLVALFIVVFPIENVKATIFYVDDDGAGNYTSIQDAIDNASDEDTVFVFNGIYYEELSVNRSINLVGESISATILDGFGGNSIISISADEVEIRNFTIQNGPEFGIITNSDNNLIIDNIITNNGIGIDLGSLSNNNFVYHNNFVNNVQQASDQGSNTWDDGYPSGGNYWDDFDEMGEGAYDNDSNRIVDSPYNIPEGTNRDRYPFMNLNGWINYPPNTPATPAGATNIRAGKFIEYTYSTFATDPDEDQVQYRFDFDADGSHDYSSWTSLDVSGHTGSFFHSWDTAGTYVVKTQALDEHGATSNWSIGLTVVVSANNPPLDPYIIGPTSGEVGTTYEYTFSSIDIDGDYLFYSIDWGDGTYEDETGSFLSGEEVTYNHKWSESDTYIITVQAIDTYNGCVGT